MKRTQILMNKLVYLGLSILAINKIVINEFRYGHVIPKYGEKEKIFYMETERKVEINT